MSIDLEQVDFDEIRNRNEQRVKEMMALILPAFSNLQLNYIDLQDIYALALNTLPARYTQKYSIVLQEPVSDEEVESAVKEALQRVIKNPNHPDRESRNGRPPER